MAEDAKVVVITGASGGIGAALVRRLGDEGMKVVLAAHRRLAPRDPRRVSPDRLSPPPPT